LRLLPFSDGQKKTPVRMISPLFMFYKSLTNHFVIS